MRQEPDLFISSGTHDKEAVAYLNELFLKAADAGSNDVHLLWQDNKLEIKLRLNGDLKIYDEIEAGMAKVFDEKLRSRANMSAAERNKPIDGRIRLKFSQERVIDVRMSLIPILGGQKIVCRILDQANAAKPLSTIEMTPMVRRAMESLIEEPEGLVLVVGPTGSGKTTTLYAALGALNNGKRNIITIENPVEYVIKGISQVNIDLHMTFASALRASLRQDPDVILVGEIRDPETAEIALQAANTGHLVLATLHANSAAMAITRLLDLGADPHTLASSLRGAIAQRLVRRLTDESNPDWVAPTEAEEIWLEKHNMLSVADLFPVVHDENQYRGRIPVIEMIINDTNVKKAILKGEGELAILNAAARQNQFETLAQAGVRLASTGYTTVGQIRGIVGEDAFAPEVKRLGDVLIDRGILNFDQVFGALEHQIDLRRRGSVKRLGQILVEQGLCTHLQLVGALGCTAGAPALLEPLLQSGQIKRREIDLAVASWRETPAGTSLFDMLLEQQLITQEQLHEPSLVFPAGSSLYLAHVGNESTQSGAEQRHSAVS